MILFKNGDISCNPKRKKCFFLFLNLKYFFELIIKINQSKKKEGKNLKKKKR